MKRALLILFLASLHACEVGQIRHPRPSTVPVVIIGSRSYTPAAPLRYAVIFNYPSSFKVTDDGPATIETIMQVPLNTPDIDWENYVTPLETAILPTRTSINIYRPRIVVYEDIDESGDFLPTSILHGVDRIVAIDSSVGLPAVAVIPYLDKVLKRMTLEESAAFYAASGNLYTPFIRVLAANGYLELLEATDDNIIRLDLSDSPIPAERFVCNRSAVYLYGNPLTPSNDLVINVDNTLDATAICGATIPSCITLNFSDTESPNLNIYDTQAYRRVVQCRMTENFEVINIQSAELNCVDCLCSYKTTAQSYFAKANEVPDWWPCGDPISYCDSNLPLYNIDASCE
ncbi:MAG: hypothetical protein JW841_13800 [Deltaproteobacteria bacterium]|nr:hypothetical protein [Deltaproteobacteria bacterium]